MLRLFKTSSLPQWLCHAQASAFEKGGKDITRFEDIGVDLNAGGG